MLSEKNIYQNNFEKVYHCVKIIQADKSFSPFIVKKRISFLTYYFVYVINII